MAGTEECKYGSSCYRINVQHFIEFTHPLVEELGQKINNGMIEEIIALNLDPKILEQAQLVSELIANGELNRVPERKRFKRSRSPETDATLQEEGFSSINQVETITISSENCEDHGSSSKKSKLEENHVITETIPLPKENSTVQQQKQSPIHDVHSASVAEKIEAAHPMRFFLSTVTNLPQTKDERLSLSFADLFDPSLGKLKESVQFNFMVEFGWLLAQYCQHRMQKKPLLIVYGAETEEMIEAPKLVPTVRVARVKPKYPFGSHHTKMAFMQYEDDSLRIVVHTGNLIESDWEDRTQGLWISPTCPLLAEASPENTGESPTFFKRDLLRYLDSYSLAVLKPWIEKVKKADMSSINVCFIASTPGSHVSHSSKSSPIWGHLQLGAKLQQHAIRDQDSSLIVQCSSIGSLGPSPSSWLVGELVQSMSRASNVREHFGSSTVRVIYPSYENVKSSIHGLAGGGCLPYSHQGHSKQLWFSAFLHHWKSDTRLRTKAMPHIKSYTCVSDDMSRAFWFVLTSANLSKAAWGMWTNKGKSLMIQSFEAGVLFLPEFIVNKDYFKVGEDIHMPFDLPLSKYSVSDQPWFIDRLRRER